MVLSLAVKSEDFVKLKFPNFPALSPDGKKLAFAVKSIDETKNRYKSGIFLKTEGQEPVIRFTAGTSVDSSPQFSPDGKYLAFLSSRAENGMQLYCMPVEGGEAKSVTNFPKGVVGFTWSNDSLTFLVSARVNEEELNTILDPADKAPSFVLKPAEYQAYKAKEEELKALKTDPRVITEGYNREGTSYLEGRFLQPFLVKLPSFDILSKSKSSSNVKHIGKFGHHYSLGTFGPGDNSVYISRTKEDPSISLIQEILKISCENPSDAELIGEAFGWIENFQLSPGGDYVSFEAIREEKIVYDDDQIFLVDLKNPSTPKITCLTSDYHRSVIQSRWFRNDSLLFLSPSNGKINIHEIKIEDRNTTSIVGGDRNILSFAVSKNKARIAYSVSHASFLNDIFWCKSDGSDEERITRSNEEFLNNRTTAQYEEFQYEREGTTFQGWLLYPRDYNRNDKLPVVLEIHGGPNAMWTPHEITLWHEWNTLVSNGYAVVFCNPRGSNGYGIDFRAAVYKDWGETPGNDILKGLDTALERYPFLDSNRVAVTGGSYGGYMTAWLVTHTDRFKAAVSQRGVYEFVAFGTTTDIPIWFEKQYEGEVIERFAEIWNDSPAAHIKNLNTPLLIIHSDNDFRVPVVNAEQLFWLGRRYKKNIEFIRYPRDGHELSRSGEPRHVIDRINRILDWIKKYT